MVFSNFALKLQQMSFEVLGKLHKKFDTERKSDKFQARDFVIELPGQYPQLIKFQLTQDRCEIIDPYNEGDEIKVYFDLRGRQWEDKFFTNLNAWKIDKGASEPVGGDAGSGNSAFPSEEPQGEEPVLPF